MEESRRLAKAREDANSSSRAISILFGLGFAALGGLAVLCIVNTWLGLLGLPFLAIGIGIVWVALRRPQLRPTLVEDDRAREPRSGQHPLPPTTTPQGELRRCWYLMIAAVLGCIGIGVPLFIAQPTTVGPVLILVPAVLVVLLMSTSIPYLWLATGNPVVALSIDHYPLRLGDPAKLTWRIEGPTRHLRRWSIVLVGRERAVYRHQDDDHPQLQAFHRQSLHQADEAHDGATGTCTIAVPADSVASFDAGTSGIDWLIEVRGKSRWRPNLKADHLLLVVP